MKKVLFLLMAAFAWFQANAVDPNVNYIEQWGRLKLGGSKGIQLCNDKGEAIQLKGWSSFGNYKENCLGSSSDLQWMKQQGANCVRIARYINGGFDDSQIKDWMAKTANEGMYCIIDWHILEAANGNGKPGSYTSQAQSFFTMVANEVKTKGYRHVIYELCNEPSGCGWSDIKSYSEQLINTITAIDVNKPIIIVGTPNWDQYIYSQVASTGNLIKTDKAGVMYAFHLYANEPAHVGLESSEFIPASSVVPIFVSEWGLSSAQPEKRMSYDDVNTAFAQTFMSHCSGQGGCGQIVSWINWSYGFKSEGASTFREKCNGQLSPSGKWIVELLGGDVDLKQKPTLCYGGDCYTLSSSSEEQILNLGNYNENPDVEKGTWAGSSGVTYYDANNTNEEGYDPEDSKDYNEKEILNYCLLDNGECPEGGYRDVLKCYAGRDWCDFRSYECVDLTMTRLLTNWGSGYYKLGWVSSGEWLLYTFDVQDAGYYSMQMAINNKKQPTPYKGDKPCSVAGALECNKETGKCTSHDGFGFDLTLVEHASQKFMVDLDASTETQEAEMPYSLFFPCVKETVDDEEVDNDDDHVWCYTGGDTLGKTTSNYGILFKEPGKYTIRLSFPNGHLGLGGLRFTYEKPWTGEGYPEEIVSVAKVLNDVESIVFPTVVADGVINVAAEGPANVKIFSLVGAEVYSASIEGASKLNVNLPSGVYSVEVASAEGSKFAKIIVK